jgi:hypothetical protein
MNESNVVMSLAGAVLALLFGYVPGLRQWYEALEPTRKALVMAGALLLASVLLYLAGCYTPWQVGVTCDETGFWTLTQMFIAALVANQATYLIGVKAWRTPVEQA